MPGDYGDVFIWLDGYRGILERDRWYCLEQQVKLNTPGQKDGILRSWVDGRMTLEKTDLRFRNVPSLKIERVWMNIYHGGKLVSDRDVHAYIDNVVISRQYVGKDESHAWTALSWTRILSHRTSRGVYPSWKRAFNNMKDPSTSLFTGSMERKGLMRRTVMSLPVLFCFLSSCGSYRPEEGQGQWRQIRWSRDYADARGRAQRENKPILVILVSGDLEADC